VAAEHNDNRSAALCRAHDRAHHAAEVARDEYVRERAEEGAKRTVIRRRVREFVGAHLVWAFGDGNRANGAQVGFGGALRWRA